MKVAFVTHQFFPHYYTGVERDTLNLATQLRTLGHDACVVTPTLGHNRPGDEYVVDGVRVRVVPEAPVPRASPWKAPRQPGIALGRILDEERPDVVHVAHSLRLPQIFDEARRRDLPFIVHLHDFDYLCYQITMVRANGQLCPGSEGGRACQRICGCETGPLRIDWGRQLLSEAAAVVSPSQFMIDVLAAEGFDTSDWHHVPCGVDYTAFETRLSAPAGDELVVGLVGTLLPHKGPQIILEAFRMAPDQRLRLILYGETFGQSEFDAALRELAGSDPRIRFAGPYDHYDLRSVLAPLHAVAIPSLWYENYPISAAIAVAAGVPIIASNVGGIKELVESFECGFTFPIGDARALASLLQQLVDDQSLLADRRRAMHFPPSIEEETWRLEQLYMQAVSRDRNSVPTL